MYPRPENQKWSTRLCLDDVDDIGLISMLLFFSRKRMLSGSATQQRESQAPPVDEKLSQFHKELTETCSDILARYAFANYSAVPQRYIQCFFFINLFDIVCLIQS